MAAVITKQDIEEIVQPFVGTSYDSYNSPRNIRNALIKELSTKGYNVIDHYYSSYIGYITVYVQDSAVLIGIITEDGDWKLCYRISIKKAKGQPRNRFYGNKFEWSIGSITVEEIKKIDQAELNALSKKGEFIKRKEELEANEKITNLMNQLLSISDSLDMPAKEALEVCRQIVSNSYNLRNTFPQIFNENN